MMKRRTVAAGIAALPLLGCGKADAPVAAKAQPKPVRASDAHGLVELIMLDPTIRLDIRYATTNNFTGRQLYSEARAFLVAPAATALVRAHRAAKAQAFGLTIHDAYHPWAVTKALWDATPPGPKKNFVANPKKGSKHNRGCAVDLTLHDLASGQPVSMPSGYDEFSPRADRSYAGAAPDVLAHRAWLERLMQAEGFRGASNEWWHFDFRGWQDYPILNVPFDQL